MKLGRWQPATMAHKPLVAVVVVNYNGYELTRDCLRSFSSVTYERHVVIVVDNASTDDPVQRLKAEFPRVRHLRSACNAGFTGGNNLGLQTARELGAEYVFFLNNDTVVSENILDELVAFQTDNPEVGIVGPLTYYYEARNIISFGGGTIDRNTGICSQQNKGRTLAEFGARVSYCNFIEGAAMFMRTALACEAGGFSNAYFLTSEESELCVRVADKGYKLAVITSCSVWHKVSRSLEGGSELRNYFVFRNKLLFVKRNAAGFGVKDLAALTRFYAKCLAWSVLKGRNLPAAKGLLLGVYDFFRGTTGPGRYEKRLNACRHGEAVS